LAQQRAEAGAVPITKIDIAMSMEVKLFMRDLLFVSTHWRVFSPLTSNIELRAGRNWRRHPRFVSVCSKMKTFGGGAVPLRKHSQITRARMFFGRSKVLASARHAARGG
jgi:hypothetical protein